MKLDLKTLQLLMLFVLFGLLYGMLIVRGAPRHTPEGLSFGMKPIVTWTRFIAVPCYFAVFAYPRWASHHSLPLSPFAFLIAVIIFFLFQLPGTIILTPTAIVQRFWLRPSKAIQYQEIMAIEELQRGNTKVLGDNRVTIIHTLNHSASDQFKKEIASRRADSKAISAG